MYFRYDAVDKAELSRSQRSLNDIWKLLCMGFGLCLRIPNHLHHLSPLVRSPVALQILLQRRLTPTAQTNQAAAGGWQSTGSDGIQG